MLSYSGLFFLLFLSLLSLSLSSSRNFDKRVTLLEKRNFDFVNSCHIWNNILLLLPPLLLLLLQTHTRHTIGERERKK